MIPVLSFALSITGVIVHQLRRSGTTWAECRQAWKGQP